MRTRPDAGRQLSIDRRCRSGGSTLNRAGPPMFSAPRRARQLFHSLLPVARMGDSTSKIISAQEALPGRKEAIVVSGKDAASVKGTGVGAAHAPLRRAAARPPLAG